MADAWQTYPFEFRGGLITNLALLNKVYKHRGQHVYFVTLNRPSLVGIDVVEGFTKFDTALLPNTGAIRGLIRYNSQVYAVRGDDLFRCLALVT